MRIPTRRRAIIRNTFASPISLHSTMGSKVSVSSLLLLLLFLVEVHSQTVPYVSFGVAGQALANNSYVDLSTVGNAGDNIVTVLCVTLTWPHVVVVVRVSIVETGLSLMELYCHPLVPVILLL